MVKSISKTQTPDRVINQLQDSLIQGIKPLIANPFLNGRLIENVSLKVGSNSINHGLGRKLQGWSIVRKRAQAGVYDTQDENEIPDKTLLLTSDAIVSVNLYVF